MLGQLIIMVSVLVGAFVLLATLTIIAAYAVDNHSRKTQ